MNYREVVRERVWSRPPKCCYGVKQFSSTVLPLGKHFNEYLIPESLLFCVQMEYSKSLPMYERALSV